jgi:hypothetical protein
MLMTQFWLRRLAQDNFFFPQSSPKLICYLRRISCQLSKFKHLLRQCDKWKNGYTSKNLQLQYWYLPLHLSRTADGIYKAKNWLISASDPENWKTPVNNRPVLIASWQITDGKCSLHLSSHILPLYTQNTQYSHKANRQDIEGIAS